MRNIYINLTILQDRITTFEIVVSEHGGEYQ